jgi:hypothetical protein
MEDRMAEREEVEIVECAICTGEFEPEEEGQTECDPTGCPGRYDGEPVQEVSHGA